MKKLTRTIFFSLSLLCIIQPDMLIAQQVSSFKDSRDGRVYKTVKIGNQVWMAENLAYLPAVSPADKPTNENAKTRPFYYVYDFNGSSVALAKNTANYKIYGVLYNWKAAQASCPPGWHLPSDQEWKILEKELGMPDEETNKNMFRMGGEVGFKLKSKSIWKPAGSNIYSFGALPGGYRFGENPGAGAGAGFGFIGEECFFWSSTTLRDFYAYRYQLTQDSRGIVRFVHIFAHGYSVRCIKDN